MKIQTLILSTALILAPVLASTASAEGMSGDMSKMQAHMQSMQTEMAQIRAIKDPTARKAAMQKHMQGMMGMMQGMDGMDHSKMMGGADHQDIAYLNQRVDLLQDMVNQMVQSRAASYGIYPDGLSSSLSDEEYQGK